MTLERWARCIHQKGTEVMRFIDDFLAESHRRVLVIGGAGFDPRSTSLASKIAARLGNRSNGLFMVHPVNGEVPPVKGRPWKLPHYANRGKTSSSGGELASARSCFSTVRTALGKLRITGLLAQFDVARSFPQFPRPLLLQPTILTSERGTRFGIRKAPNHVPTSPFTG